MTLGIFGVSESGNSVLVSMGTSDATAASVQFGLQMKLPSQEWADVSYSYFTKAVGGGTANQEVRLVLNQPTMDLRARIQDLDTLEYTAYRTATWTSAAVEVDPEVAVLNARTWTYKQVRDALIERYYSAAPSAAEMVRIAQFITSANRQVLEEWPWAEAMISTTVDVTDGLVTWTALQGADYYQFWTVNPWAEATRDEAQEVRVLKASSEGLYLAPKDLTTVFVSLSRRAPTFSSVELVGATSYGYGHVGYNEATGHCYECIAADGALGSQIGDADKWRSLPILWLLLEPILNLAEAQLFSRSQERGQASSLRAAASEQLDVLTRRQSQS